MSFTLNITADTLEEFVDLIESHLNSFNALVITFATPRSESDKAEKPVKKDKLVNSKNGEIDGDTFDEGLDESEFDDTVIDEVIEEAREEVIDETPKLDSKKITALVKRLNEVCGREAVSSILKACSVKLTADIPERHFARVFEVCNEYISKKLAAKEKEFLKAKEIVKEAEIPASELFDAEEEPTDTPSLEVMKAMAKVMNKMAPLDYRKLVKEYSVTSARSFVTLSDDSKISLFAKMNDFVGKNTPA